MNGLVNRTFGQAAHPQEPFFQFAQINFEVSFHRRFLPARNSQNVGRRASPYLIRTGR
jgi:hypothetical protein